MLIVHCPVCGAEGDETDFHYGGEAHIRRPATHDPANVSDAEQRDYLFMRRNPEGPAFRALALRPRLRQVVSCGARHGDHGVQGDLRHQRIAAARMDGSGDRRMGAILQGEASRAPARRSIRMSGKPYRLPPGAAG